MFLVCVPIILIFRLYKYIFGNIKYINFMKKAIFLVGGPGSGKDIVLRKVLGAYDLQELKLEQLKEDVIQGDQSIVINTNAYNFDGVISNKNLLEDHGFETSMIFVDVSDKISKQRLSSRNISEEIRRKRLKESKKNILAFGNSFSYFTIFENNSTEQNKEIDELTIFCESFLYLESILEEKSKKLATKKFSNKSIKNKLLRNFYPNDLVTKVQTDRIGDEYSVRNSGIGYPSTVGPFYNESFADYAADLPAFTSDSTSPRSIPSQEKYSEKPNLEITKSRIKNIKKIAKTCWKGG